VGQARHDHTYDREDPSRVGGASWKGDRYSRQLQEDPFNPYSLSSLHPADRVHPDSDEEDSSDDSYSSNGSGSETAAPNPRSGKGTGSGTTYKTRSTAPSIPAPALPSLEIHRRSSNPPDLSKSKSQQPWVAETSGYKEKESARLPAQPTSRQDARGRGADTDFVVGSYRGEVGGGPGLSISRTMSQQPWLGQPATSSDSQSRSGLSISKAMSQQPWVGQPAASSDSQSRSGHKEKEGARASGQPSSNRPDPLRRATDTEFVVGSYRGEAGGGLSGLLTDYQSRSGNRDKESARSSGQPSSSRPDRRDRGADTDFVVGSYRGEPGGGISGHPSDSQSRSGNKEKEGARSSGQPSSSRQEPRVRETDADYGIGGQGSVGGYRGEASGGASGQPQPRTGKPAPVLAPSSTQQPSGKQPEYTSANRSPYAERNNRSSITPTATMGTTEHSSRPPPNPTTSIPHRQEEGPPYNTRGSGRGSSQPADPSRTTPYGAFPPTRPPQHAAQYSHPSQAQAAGTTGSYPWGAQPTGAPPGWSAHPPHRVFFFFHFYFKISNHDP
jgi:hypothetical protein